MVCSGEHFVHALVKDSAKLTWPSTPTFSMLLDSANDFQGVVPHKFIYAMTQLRHLRLHMNGFFGALQKEIVPESKPIVQLDIMNAEMVESITH